jgi:hypothetical protein
MMTTGRRATDRGSAPPDAANAAAISSQSMPNGLVEHQEPVIRLSGRIARVTSIRR